MIIIREKQVHFQNVYKKNPLISTFWFFLLKTINNLYYNVDVDICFTKHSNLLLQGMLV